MTGLIFPNSKSLEESLLRCLSKSDVPLSNNDIEQLVIDDLKLDSNIVSLIRSGSRTELQYRLAWARTKLKSKGLIVKVESQKWSVVAR
jgi:restriction endonuclease Mrr